MSRRLLAAGAALFAAGNVAGYLLFKPNPGTEQSGASPQPANTTTSTDSGSSNSANTVPCSSCSAADRLARFSELAADYDDSIGRDELLMGLGLARRFLLRQATGDVLEVAVGTARNADRFPGGLRSLTVTDASADMLAVAHKKLAAAVDGGSFGRHAILVNNSSADGGAEAGTTMCQSPSSSSSISSSSSSSSSSSPPNTSSYTRVVLSGPMPAERLAFADNSFDTVVDTFGLCSFADPALALAEMARVCRPGGRILLLEHGRAHYAWLNRLLDAQAPQHAARWGCLWNRDIAEVVRAAPLAVDRLWRFHFGTTYLIQGSPAK